VVDSRLHIYQKSTKQSKQNVGTLQKDVIF